MHLSIVVDYLGCNIKNIHILFGKLRKLPDLVGRLIKQDFSVT